jgi:group I intron endonuclease
MIYGYVYKATNLINGRIYIGQNKAINFIPGYMGSGVAIKLSIKKYGRQSFKVELIAEAHDKKSLDVLEKYYIGTYRKKMGIGKLYNIAEGGNGGSPMSGKHHTDIGKRNISLSRMVHEVSQETRDRIRMKLKNQIVPKAIRSKISNTLKKYIKTDLHRKHLSEAGMGHPNTRNYAKNP